MVNFLRSIWSLVMYVVCLFITVVIIAAAALGMCMIVIGVREVYLSFAAGSLIRGMAGTMFAGCGTLIWAGVMYFFLEYV